MADIVIVIAPPGSHTWSITISDDSLSANTADLLVGFIGTGGTIGMVAAEDSSNNWADAIQLTLNPIGLVLSDDEGPNWADSVITQMNRIPFRINQTLTMADFVQVTMDPIGLNLSDSLNSWADAATAQRLGPQGTENLSDNNGANWKDALAIGFTECHLTQLPVEVLTSNTPLMEVTQLPVIVLSSNVPKMEVTQLAVQVLVQKPRQPRVWISS